MENTCPLTPETHLHARSCLFSQSGELHPPKHLRNSERQLAQSSKVKAPYRATLPPPFPASGKCRTLPTSSQPPRDVRVPKGLKILLCPGNQRRMRIAASGKMAASFEAFFSGSGRRGGVGNWRHRPSSTKIFFFQVRRSRDVFI